MKASDRYFVDGIACRLDGESMRVANLSLGGFFAATERPPVLGQSVVMELMLSGRPPFAVVGRVSWVNDPAAPRAPDLPQGFGVKIVKIEFPDKLAIVDLIKRAGREAARNRTES